MQHIKICNPTIVYPRINIKLSSLHHQLLTLWRLVIYLLISLEVIILLSSTGTDETIFYNFFEILKQKLQPCQKVLIKCFLVDSNVFNIFNFFQTEETFLHDFLVILKQLLQYYQNIQKKYFLSTTCIVICLACSNPQPYHSVLLAFKWLNVVSWKESKKYIIG